MISTYRVDTFITIFLNKPKKTKNQKTQSEFQSSLLSYNFNIKLDHRKTLTSSSFNCVSILGIRTKHK